MRRRGPGDRRAHAGLRALPAQVQAEGKVLQPLRRLPAVPRRPERRPLDRPVCDGARAVHGVHARAANFQPVRERRLRRPVCPLLLRQVQVLRRHAGQARVPLRQVQDLPRRQGHRHRQLPLRQVQRVHQHGVQEQPPLPVQVPRCGLSHLQPLPLHVHKACRVHALRAYDALALYDFHLPASPPRRANLCVRPCV